MKAYEIFLWLFVICCVLGFILIGIVQMKYYIKYGPLSELTTELGRGDSKKMKIAIGLLILGALFFVIGLITKP